MATEQEQEQRFTEILEAGKLGLISEDEADAELRAAGVTISDGGSIEDAPDEMLATFYAAAKHGRSGPNTPKAYHLYIASLLVDRGLTACGCETCREIEADARRWHAAVKANSCPMKG